MSKAKRIALGALGVLAAVGFIFFYFQSRGGNDDLWEGLDAGGTETFTYWMYKTVDSQYYASYDQNPAMKIMNRKTWGEDNIRLKFEYWVPPAGTASDNYSNMIGSGDYADLIENTVGDTPVTTWREGITMDLTDLVKEYMPNYLAWLDAHPAMKEYAVTMVDGEEKYLKIVAFNDEAPDLYWGHMYRRDWIVKYGKNPVTGEGFTGGYDENNLWTDDVVFPSGGTDPVYISDWEWMFSIFQTAYADLGLTDSYCYTIPYNGYLQMGELSASFGGGASGFWYRDLNNQVVFGPVTDQFRAYLQCMNTWYKNSWLDPHFDERTNDMFYMIDSTNVYQGKIGMWYGLEGMLDRRLDNGDPLTSGICVFGCSTPINDMYGPDETRYKEPYCNYATNMNGKEFVISVAAKDKNLGALLTMFDYLYTEEGALLKSVGLSKEQYEATQDPFMTEQGLVNGAYTLQEDGSLLVDPIITNDSGSLLGACRLDMFPGLVLESRIDMNYTPVFQRSVDSWKRYPNLGYFDDQPVMTYLTSDETRKTNNYVTKIRDYMALHVPEFIKGVADPFNETDWGNWVKMMNKYGYQKYIDIVQPYIDEHPLIISAE